ncbi:MAG: phage tail sheath subtilisin-like domain-containing protein [Planctomycetes bacterium]|nr:phage tail sheath subtilisin-like domain-containing protein [Planctomycetota bacterium]
MATYKTPDVYVEEISLFPPSVAEVESAVPAFIGHTEKAEFKGQDLTNKPTRIKSLVEYEERFGKGPEPLVAKVVLDGQNNVASASLDSTYVFYDSLRLFFANGGGKCYIVSVGGYRDALSKDDFAAGLEQLRREDEPTMLLFPDATKFASTNELYALQQAALKQAGELMDRFVIMDLAPAADTTEWWDTIEEFRSEVGIENLKYGAAYTPYLKTGLSKEIRFRTIHDKLEKFGVPVQFESMTSDTDILARIARLRIAIANSDLVLDSTTGALAAFLAGHNSGSSTPGSLGEAFERYYATYNQAVQTVPASAATDAASVVAARVAFVALLSFAFDLGVDYVQSLLAGSTPLAQPTDTDQSAFKDVEGLVRNQLSPLFRELVAFNLGAGSDRVGADIGKLWQDGGTSQLSASVWGTDFDTVAADNSIYPKPGATTAELVENLKSAGEAITASVRNVIAAVDSIPIIVRQHESTGEGGLRDVFTTYKNIADGVAREATLLPPSGAIAGVYAKIDRQRGCWKAPANVSLAEVVGLAVQIDNKDQEELNVDVVAGKSINALRTFTGKGHLVWGARTLAGNDNEWRYVSVRRFFSVVEESIKKSTYWAVFEPNDANLWVKVKGMIENYLTLKWRDGALAGAKPEHAFFVKVGLNQTMTAIDILEGRLIVEIGMAVVRPAEFIILRFSHKMQQS